MLREYREAQGAIRKRMGYSLTDEDFVFLWPDGRPVDPDVVTKTFHRILGKAGITNIRLHNLRHTHATLMLTARVHPKVVSERLGHANIGITLDIYKSYLWYFLEYKRLRLSSLTGFSEKLLKKTQRLPLAIC